jgi:hypothetical protein
MSPTLTRSRALVALLVAVALVALVVVLVANATRVDVEGDPSSADGSSDDADSSGDDSADGDAQPDGDGDPQTRDIETTSTAGDGDGNADVLFVSARQETDGTWTFAVTVEHPDTGEDDFADGWDVVMPDGTVYKSGPREFTRELLHPHVGEQPFTRSQGAISLPADVTVVLVRAHDSVDGYGGREVTVDLTVDSGEDFEVERLR